MSVRSAVMREGDRYAAATAFLAKLGVDSTEVDALLASGLKWNSVGASVPPEGSALDAPALASALESKACFSRAEWDEFRIDDLRMDHFVKCRGEYFKPVLLVGGVETSNDDRLPVPALVKKQWQQWNQTGAHPDKGGDTEAYCVRKQEYTAFKMRFAEWLQAHPTGQPDFKTWCRSSMPASRGILAEDASRRTKQKAELKEQGEKALQAAQKALEEKQYEDAKELASVAVRHFEDCQSKSKVSDKVVRDMIDRANGVIGQAEEGVRRRQEEARKQEAIEGLDRLWRSVCASDPEEAQALTADDPEEAQALTAHDELIAATSVMNDMLEAEQMQQMQQERLLADRGLDWAQKIAAVQDHFTDEKV